MCKYANNKPVEVSDIKQLETIKKVLGKKSNDKKIVIHETEFNEKLWIK